jgi:TetR/AcrR family transcriptional repressor of nem operon
MIISRSANLFNSRGFAGASMSDVMSATGLEKGGIYNHFASKDELALAAFDHIIAVHTERVGKIIDGGTTCEEKLIKLVEGFQLVVTDPTFKGGCPLLNCAVESDDTHPALRARVQIAIKKILKAIETIVQRGIDLKEFDNNVEPLVVAQFLFASLEGGILLAKLYDEPHRLDVIANQLTAYVRSLRQTGGQLFEQSRQHSNGQAIRHLGGNVES